MTMKVVSGRSTTVFIFCLLTSLVPVWALTSADVSVIRHSDELPLKQRQTSLARRLPGLKSGDDRFSPRIQEYISFLETREPPSPFSLLEIGASSKQEEVKKGQTLFMVYSDSALYKSRLRWVSDTWASNVDKSRIMVIGDVEANTNVTLPLRTTKCPPHSHWEGACCKYAEAAIEAYDHMSQDPDIKWVYFTDDDAYVRPSAMETALAAVDAEGDDAKVWGTWGCATKDCPHPALCAGGGYALSRRSVQLLMRDNPAAFLREQMDNCGKCNKWADIAMSQAFVDRQLEKSPFAGLHGWRMQKAEFDESLKGEPLMYHYISTKGQMEMLHKLFTSKTSELDSSNLVTLQGEAQRQQGNCATYRGNMQCGDFKDLPWDANKEATAPSSSFLQSLTKVKQWISGFLP